MGDSGKIPELSKFKQALMAVAADDRVRLLMRLEPQRHYAPRPPGVTLQRGCVIDTETTGKNTEVDLIIEIAIVPFLYTPEGEVIEVLEDEVYVGLQDPGHALSDEIVRVTGLTDDDLQGQIIDVRRVESALADCKVVIAHNAKFDRPLCERLTSAFADKYWLCSMSMIDWRAEGAASVALQSCAAAQMLWFKAHRALDDARALLHLLTMPLPESGDLPLQRMRERLERPSCEIWLRGTPFGARPDLMKAGFTWRPDSGKREKGWVRIVQDEQFHDVAEQACLLSTKHGSRPPDFLRVNPKDLFSDRVA